MELVSIDGALQNGSRIRLPPAIPQARLDKNTIYGLINQGVTKVIC
jgi:hypothetical protein